MVITVEIYKEIRKRRLDGESQWGIARALGISQNTIKKYWEGAKLPGEKIERPWEPSVLTSEVTAFIAACLKADEDSPGKQRHTAKRIYDRLVEEMHFTGGETTVRGYVRAAREAFVPLAFAPGEAVQIDWGEATGWVDGVKLVANLFCARLCHSAVPFVMAYRRQNSESFQDGLIHAFEYFGGVPRRVIFDNAKVAVKDGSGANAKATDSYVLLAAHYGFEPVFCNVRSGNEKGLVENLVGLCRRNFCVPVPRAESMDELNVMLLEGCKSYLTHQIRGKEADVGAMFNLDREALYPLPAYRFDPARAGLLILDELSYLSFNRHQSELLFKVISDRSEKSSTIVTTNLPFSRWTELFENTTMVAALVDRLTFRSHVLDMNGESFRLKSALA